MRNTLAGKMISVVVPVYNTNEYLGKCIESILGQTYSELKLIVVNDGSTDSSLDTLREYEKKDSRMIVVDCLHRGVSASRNEGIERSEGEYIAFIDSDDWLDEKAFEILIRHIEEENFDAIYYDWTEEYADGNHDFCGHDGKTKIYIDEPLKALLNNKIPMRISSGVFRRKLISKHRFEEGRSEGEDMLFAYEMAKESSKAVYINYPFYHRYNRIGSLSLVEGFNVRDVEIANCTDTILADVKDNYPDLVELAYRYSFNFYMMVENYISYYNAEDQFCEEAHYINHRLDELWEEIGKPRNILPKSRYYAFLLYSKQKNIYKFLTRIYYKIKGGRTKRIR